MGQNVTLVAGDWQERGIILLPASAPEFNTLLSTLAPGTQSDLSPLSTYSFILQNLTLKPVIAFGVRWTCVAADGRSRTRDGVVEPHKLIGVIDYCFRRGARRHTHIEFEGES
jgi:hypothetical protein